MESEREEDGVESIKVVSIGTAVLRRKEMGDKMSFVLPMEFRGLKMGELTLKVNY